MATSKVWTVAQWLLKHSASVPAILSCVDSIGDASNFVEGSVPLKQLIDIVAPIADDFPDLSGDVSIMEASDALALEQQTMAAGFDFGKLLEAAERLSVLMPLLLELWAKMKPKT